MNKYFNKQTVLSFVLGGILFSSVGVFAATQLNVVPNNFPILVNGKNTDIEGYNIEGRTYLQLKDTTDVLDADLNFKDNTIYINTDDTDINKTPEATLNPTSTPIVTSTPTPTSDNINIKNESEVKENMSQISTPDQRKNKPKSTQDGITDIDIYDGKYYIGIAHIQDKIKEKQYDLIMYLDPKTNKDSLKLVKENSPIKDKIEFTHLTEFGYDAIEFSYYDKIILPLIQ